eukprot:94212-Pleurochrysis_carterae.AAC.1
MLAHRRRLSTTNAGSNTSTSASSTAQSRPTSFARPTKLPTASPRGKTVISLNSKSRSSAAKAKGQTAEGRQGGREERRRPKHNPAAAHGRQRPGSRGKQLRL